MSKNLAVIGVGNMAKAIISGIKKSDIQINKYFSQNKLQEIKHKLFEKPPFLLF